MIRQGGNVKRSKIILDCTTVSRADYDRTEMTITSSVVAVDNIVENIKKSLLAFRIVESR